MVMHRGLTLLLLLLVCASCCVAARAPRRRPLRLPRQELQEVLAEGEEEDLLLSDDHEVSLLTEAQQPGRLRHALEALLALNDGELSALMKGAAPAALAPRLAPDTQMFLASSRQRLARLSTFLTEGEQRRPLVADAALPASREHVWNPRIARRRKKNHKPHHHGAPEESQAPAGDSDSILGALTELSEYLNGEDAALEAPRKRRSHKHQQTHQYERHHYLYYLRTHGESKYLTI